jgi:hypothetical protein
MKRNVVIAGQKRESCYIKLVFLKSRAIPEKGNSGKYPWPYAALPGDGRDAFICKFIAADNRVWAT